MKKYVQRFKVTFLAVLVVAAYVGLTSMNLVSTPPTTDTEPTITNTTQENSSTYYTLDKLPLNRKGRGLNYPSQIINGKLIKARYPHAHTGFLFDKGDNNTKKWRPQGIAGTSVKGKNFIIVSWYGRKEAGYNDRGGRISIVNVTDMGKIKYRNVLLVDQNGKSMPGNHVGGLAVIGNKLHTVDSRGRKSAPYGGPNGTYDRGLVFDLTKVEKVAEPVLNYEYILRVESTYDLPFNPSYISYDKVDKKLLVGSFYCCGANPTCDMTDALATKFVWFTPGNVDRNTSFTTPLSKKKFCEMQGAATVTRDGKQYLFTSSSYGMYPPSRLNIFVKKGDKWDWMHKIPYAPGLEDVYFSSKNMWTLTEFRPGEGGNLTNDRAVVAIRTSKLLDKAKAAYKITKSLD